LREWEMEKAKAGSWFDEYQKSRREEKRIRTAGSDDNDDD
jgi:hypothetical protein